MKYIITESQLKLLHEMSDDIPMFIKRRLTAINNALEHATSPNSVVQPEDYNIDYDYVDDVFNAIMDELTWETFGDGLTEEQESELREYLMEYHSDEIMDHYRMIVGDDDDDDEDLYESFDKIISEQSNVYTDEVKYKKALYKYNKEMSIYKAFLELYQKIPNLLDKDPYYEMLKGKNDKFKGPTYLARYKLQDLTSPSLKVVKKLLGYNLDNLLEELSLFYSFTNKLKPEYYRYSPKKGIYDLILDFQPNEFDNSLYGKLGKPKINKWYKVRFSLGEGYFTNLWIPLFENPLTKKPILQKSELPKVTPLPTQPSKTVAPKSVPPTSVQSNIDKTKPVDFYFGNRIFRAPDYQIALNFANKLSLKNFNSNQVRVLDDKTNERLFVGPNDKIYVSKESYDADPNRNIYLEPVKMGLTAL